MLQGCPIWLGLSWAEIELSETQHLNYMLLSMSLYTSSMRWILLLLLKTFANGTTHMRAF